MKGNTQTLCSDEQTMRKIFLPCILCFRSLNNFLWTLKMLSLALLPTLIFWSHYSISFPASTLTYIPLNMYLLQLHCSLPYRLFVESLTSHKECHVNLVPSDQSREKMFSQRTVLRDGFPPFLHRIHEGVAINHNPSTRSYIISSTFCWVLQDFPSFRRYAYIIVT